MEKQHEIEIWEVIRVNDMQVIATFNDEQGKDKAIAFASKKHYEQGFPEAPATIKYVAHLQTTRA